jgi:hypothetical protein
MFTEASGWEAAHLHRETRATVDRIVYSAFMLAALITFADILRTDTLACSPPKVSSWSFSLISHWYGRCGGNVV